MSDLKSTLDRGLRGFSPSPQALERTLTLTDRWRRNRRIGTAALALIIAVAAIGGVFRAFRTAEAPQPGSQQISRSNVSTLHVVGRGTFGGQPRSIAVADGRVYVQAKGGNDLTEFPADCATSCDPVWVADTGANHPVTPEFAPWAAGGIVYVGTDDLYAYSSTCGTGGATCDPLWVGKVRGDATEPALGDGAVFVISLGGKLYRFPSSCDAPDGVCRPDWVSATQPTNLFHPQVVGDSVVAQRFASPAYVAFPTSCAARSGCQPASTWAPPAGAVRTAVPTSAGGITYMGVTTGSGGELVAYPPSCATGGGHCSPSWTARFTDEINAPPPIAADGKVFVGSTVGGFLKAFPAECGAATCDPLWSATVQNLDWTHPAVTNGLVYAGSRDGGVYAFPTDCGTGDAVCKPAWTWGTAIDGAPVRIQAVAATGERVYAISNDGDLYVFGPGRPPIAPASSGKRSAPYVYAFLVAAIATGGVVLRRRRIG